ncbi:rod shape-determining protein MreD [Winogradskyella sp. DF17]|uniref:Rod shape-determining protein MreD n=1 Tax=Winogradskyella pelagia TaxID=2819984 RepID=A0ABS3SZG4_9FLAO|nr:rod shape-determining protein MreD [Winogradskyella sp. DF17]MBO3115877.1 rod shape-determining protein MreD [Winogradskyella sp. DF17]
MNSSIGLHIIRFVTLILLQVAIFNNINFLGYINPYVYIIFIFLFPIRDNRLILLLVSFVLGMALDMFLDSGGVHAGASVVLAYSRPILLKFSFGMLYEHQSVNFNNSEIGSLISYVAIGTLLHHLVLFSLEIFNIGSIWLILKKTLFSSIFTLIVSILIIILFSQNRK